MPQNTTRCNCKPWPPVISGRSSELSINKYSNLSMPDFAEPANKERNLHIENKSRNGVQRDSCSPLTRGHTQSFQKWQAAILLPVLYKNKVAILLFPWVAIRKGEGGAYPFNLPEKTIKCYGILYFSGIGNKINSMTESVQWESTRLSCVNADPKVLMNISGLKLDYCRKFEIAERWVLLGVEEELWEILKKNSLCKKNLFSFLLTLLRNQSCPIF